MPRFSCARFARFSVSAAAAVLVSAGSVSAGSFGVAGDRVDPEVVIGTAPTGPGTGLLTVPRDLCLYPDGLPAGVAAAIRQRADYPALLA